MPWLDFGDLPSSYQKNKQPAYQAYVIPKDKMPKTIYFPYKWYRRGFDKRSGLKKLEMSDLVKANNLKEADLEETLDKASQLLMPYRGFCAKAEMIKNTVIGVTFAFMFGIVVSVGYASETILPCAIIVILWLSIVIPTVYFGKMLYNKKYF